MKHHEWLNQNCLRSFPLAEDTGRASLNMGWALPDFILCDASLVVQECDAGIYIQSCTITERVLSIVLASVATGAAIGTASVVKGIDGAYARKSLHALVDGVRGFITFGTPFEPGNSEILQRHRGFHIFPTSMVLESHVVLATGPFPVQSLGVSGISGTSGLIEFGGTSAMQISMTQGTHNGDPLDMLQIGLSDPTRFLSPCEQAVTPCDCAAMPILSINGVVPDEQGIITIELVDDNGQVRKLGADVLLFLLTRTGVALCARPVMPDQYGRLPSGSGDFEQDAKPVTDYKVVGDETFPSPVL